MDFATKHRLSGVHAYVELVESAGLMSYVPSYAGMHRRAAYFVDKILKSAKPLTCQWSGQQSSSWSLT